MIERMIMRKNQKYCYKRTIAAIMLIIDTKQSTINFTTPTKKLKYNQPQRAISIAIVAIIAITSSIVIVVNVSTHLS